MNTTLPHFKRREPVKHSLLLALTILMLCGSGTALAADTPQSTTNGTATPFGAQGAVLGQPAQPMPSVVDPKTAQTQAANSAAQEGGQAKTNTDNKKMKAAAIKMPPVP